MLEPFNLFAHQSNTKIGFFLLVVNIIFYLLTFLFLIFFFFFFNLNTLKSLSDLKQVTTNSFVFISIIIALFSFSGMPPLLGFFSKFLVVIFLMSNNNFILISLFFFLNIFLIFFYIQNIKYLKKKKNFKSNNIKKSIENKYYVSFNFLTLFSFFNFCGIFCLETLFIIIQNVLIF